MKETNIYKIDTNEMQDSIYIVADTIEEALNKFKKAVDNSYISEDCEITSIVKEWTKVLMIV